MPKYTIRKARNNIVFHRPKGYAVFANGHRIEIGIGEPNWFPTKKQALKYKKECEGSD